MIEPIVIVLLNTKKFSTFHISPKTVKKREFFTDVINKNITENDNHLDFQSDQARNAIEPYIEKARDSRDICRKKDLQPFHYYAILDICHLSFHDLIKECDLSYDTTVYPFAQLFANILKIDNISDLQYLHHRYNSDQGNLRYRDEKQRLMSPFLNPITRKPFHNLYVKFILKYIAPHVYNITQSTKLYFQLFPCIRLVRPGDFSIGAHCDSSYGFSQGTLPVYCYYILLAFVANMCICVS